MGKPFQFSYHGRNSSLILLIIMATSTLSLAGIPSGYYDDADGKSGSALKSALHDIVSDHTKKTYTQAWDIIKESDEDPNNSNNVILLYSGRSQEKEYRDHGSSWDYTQYDGGAGVYNESWNREHVWAKSHGFPSESDTAYSDCHHLRPVDRSINSSRNNKDFDNGGTLHSETTDCYTDSDSWEPRDEVKGDVARMLFYMVIRYDPGYHSDNSQYDLELIDSTGEDIGVAPGRPVIGKLSTLLAWHEADTVDAFERNRNEVVYGYQGNRNPFIDHPSYVDSIWNDALPAPTNLQSSNVTETSLTLSWADNAGDETGYYVYQASSKVGTLSANVTTTNITGLTSGTTYTFQVSAYKSSEESAKASLDVTTGGTGNLVISGVYDGPLGGGTPKGVELYVIAAIADLSSYGIGSATNGGGTDGQEFTFPAESATAGDFLYVAYENTEFTTWFGFAADYTSGAVEVNGDDAIELFYNGSAIDVFGEISVDGSGQAWEYLDGWAYSKDNRSATITFNTANWTYSGINALDGETTNATASTKVPVGTFSTTDSSLPVELSVWKATSSYGQVKLTWVTESEIENQGFNIERKQNSEDRIQNTWAEISTFATNPELLGQGSTSAQNDYAFIDKQVQVGKTYSYRLADVDYRGRKTRHPEIQVIVRDAGADLKPSDVQLHKAFPNPFNPDVNLSFTLQKDVGNLSLEIYDIQGALVQTLTSGYQATGAHTFGWNGYDNQHRLVPSGIYLVRLSTGSVVQIQRVTLLR